MALECPTAVFRKTSENRAFSFQLSAISQKQESWRLIADG